MSARNKKQKNRRATKQSAVVDESFTGTGESRGAETLTVAWMLATMATFFTEVVAGGCWLVMWIARVEDHRLWVMPRLALFVGAITGFVVLMMTPLVQRVRRVKPPAVITRAALAIGLVPLVAILVILLFPG